jgi:hypothetical protein
MCIFFLYKLFFTAISQIGHLRANSDHLDNGVVDGLSADDHCRGLVQFIFAADRIPASSSAPKGWRIAARTSGQTIRVKDPETRVEELDHSLCLKPGSPTCSLGL